MQKPIQDVITAVLFVTTLLVVVMAGAMAARLPGESGIEPPGMTLTRVATDSASSSPKSMPVHETGRYNDCEVIYHRASLRSEYGIIASETEQEAMPALYHAVYTCTCPSVMATFSA